MKAPATSPGRATPTRRCQPFFAATRYVNYLADDEPDPAGAVYGANYARLRDLKTKYDPNNFFKGNVNIQPR